MLFTLVRRDIRVEVPLVEATAVSVRSFDAETVNCPGQTSAEVADLAALSLEDYKGFHRDRCIAHLYANDLDHRFAGDGLVPRDRQIVFRIRFVPFGNT